MTLPQQDESRDVEDGEGEVDVREDGDKEEEDSGGIELGLDWKGYVVPRKRKVLAQIVANEQNGASKANWTNIDSSTSLWWPKDVDFRTPVKIPRAELDLVIRNYVSYQPGELELLVGGVSERWKK